MRNPRMITRVNQPINAFCTCARLSGARSSWYHCSTIEHKYHQHALSFLLALSGVAVCRWQWQAGAITALQERYDLSAVDFVGASAGALAATLAACDADMNLAMTLALELCDTNEVGGVRSVVVGTQDQTFHYNKARRNDNWVIVRNHALMCCFGLITQPHAGKYRGV